MRAKGIHWQHRSLTWTKVKNYNWESIPWWMWNAGRKLEGLAQRRLLTPSRLTPPNPAVHPPTSVRIRICEHTTHTTYWKTTQASNNDEMMPKKVTAQIERVVTKLAAWQTSHRERRRRTANPQDAKFVTTTPPSDVLRLRRRNKANKLKLKIYPTTKCCCFSNS